MRSLLLFVAALAIGALVALDVDAHGRGGCPSCCGNTWAVPAAWTVASTATTDEVGRVERRAVRYEETRSYYGVAPSGGATELVYAEPCAACAPARGACCHPGRWGRHRRCR